MTNSSVSEPKRSSLFWRLYTLTWVGLAGVAVGYLAVVLTNPELGAELARGKGVASLDHSESIKVQKQVTAELQTLRETVSSLRDDLARVETKVAGTVKSSSPKVQTASEAPVPAGAEKETAQAPAIPAIVPLPEGGKAPQVSTQVVKTQPIRVGKLPPLPVRGPERPRRVAATQIKTGAGPAVVINSGQLVTGSVPKSGAATVTPQNVTAPSISTPNFEAPSVRFEIPRAAETVASGVPATAVVVSAATSLAGLRASWDQLSRNHPALLGTLEPRYDAMGSDGGPYRLLAGPLSDRVEADRLCSELRANGVSCGVGEFVGKSLFSGAG